jgi:hypothetical protein
VLTISVMAGRTGQAQLPGRAPRQPTAARLNLGQAGGGRGPGARGGRRSTSTSSRSRPAIDDEYTAFVRTVRSELNKQAPGYQLTFDTTGFVGNYPIQAATAPGGADAIFVMGYDLPRLGLDVRRLDRSGVRTRYDLQDTIDAYDREGLAPPS